MSRPPHSSTKVEQKFGLWRVYRYHECDAHETAVVKWFFRRESAARYAKVWMDYLWVYCWNTWSGNYTH